MCKNEGVEEKVVTIFYMPIKLPKGFQRRKSSGNALEELQNLPDGSSFRVIDRHSRNGESFGGGHNFADRWDGEPVKGVFQDGEGIENRAVASRRPSSQPMQR